MREPRYSSTSRLGPQNSRLGPQHRAHRALNGPCSPIKPCRPAQKRTHGGHPPHRGLPPSFNKSTCPDGIDFQAIPDTILVTLHTDTRGPETFIVHRVGGFRCVTNALASLVRNDASHKVELEGFVGSDFRTSRDQMCTTKGPKCLRQVVFR